MYFVFRAFLREETLQESFVKLILYRTAKMFSLAECIQVLTKATE